MDEQVIEEHVSDAHRISHIQREIEEHLSHYGAAREAIIARLSAEVIEILKEDLRKRKSK
jgi:hypothetical protein